MRSTTIPSHLHGRIDSVLAQMQLGLSRKDWRALFDAGRVRVNGHRVRPSHMCQGGEELEWHPLEAAQSYEPTIAFEDANVLVLDKDAGIGTSAIARSELPSVESYLQTRAAKDAKWKNLPESGLVHRLDVETSGLVLVAKTEKAFERFVSQVRRDPAGLDPEDFDPDRKPARKTYLAVVSGTYNGPNVIDLRIDANDRKKVRVFPPDRSGSFGVDSVTRVELLQSSSTHSLLSVRIEAAARHQIRAHLAAVGFPIVGDTTYGSTERPLPRHLLHSYRLEIPAYQDGALCSWTSAWPDAFAQLGFPEIKT